MGERYPIARAAGQTVEAMAAQLEETANNRLNRKPIYSEISAELKQEILQKSIAQGMEALNRIRGERTNLDDLEAVEAATRQYLEACTRAGTVPSISGFSASLGISRQWFHRYIETHNTPSARYLDAVRAMFAGILEQMALNRATSEPVSIFLLKNSGTGQTDRLELQAQPINDPNDSEITADDILKRYADTE